MEILNSQSSEISQEQIFTDYQEYFLRRLSREPCFSSRISPDGSMVAVSFGDGYVHILSTDFHTVLYKFRVPAQKSEITVADEYYPVTGLSWLPSKSDS